MKPNKKDIINIFIILVCFFIAFIIIMWNQNLYGSVLDWGSQHYALPQYFRTLFYETKSLFPDFAGNIGNGQNLYNFAYYGFLSPVILLSYLLPFIHMANYIVISTLTLVIASVLLVYKWLRNNNFDENVSFLASFLFMCATPLLFHSHRQIMFINYMPFLILGLIGIDKYISKNTKSLIVLATFLLIMTSFYFSISAIVVMVIYYIYKYLIVNPQTTFKYLLINIFKFVCLILISVLMAGILILPTFAVILSGRGKTNVSINVLKLFLPKVHLSYLIYNSYGIGLISIAFLGIVNLFKKDKSKLFLGGTLSLFILFPIFNYILNATMYIDAKILIPQLPLYTLLLAILFKDLFTKKFNYKINLIGYVLIILLALINPERSYAYYILIDVALIILTFLFYKKNDKKLIVIIPICLFSFMVTIGISKIDKLADRDFHTGESYKNLKNINDEIINSDPDYYRISNQVNIATSLNNTYNNPRVNISTLYSSTYNKNYNNFYYDISSNSIQSRNRVITSSTKNIMFLMLTGNKYYIDKINNNLIGYERVKTGKYSIYKGEDTFPIGYSTNNLLDEESFLKMSSFYKDEALLKNIVVKNKGSITTVSNINKYELDFNNASFQNIDIKEENDYYLIKAKKDAKINLNLTKPLRNELLFIRFNILKSQSCNLGDLGININGVNNKLTCSSWKYHNQNYNFDYVISNKMISNLNIKFLPGEYKIDKIEVYTLNYSSIKDSKSNFDPLIINTKNTIGDKISGTIDVKEDGYFVATIPYDKGFKIFVDDKNVKPEKVNTAFIGFPIQKGKHQIDIEYEAPFKKMGLYISSVGFIFYIFIIATDYKEKSTNKKLL